jgi:anaphase-promoting complex subunit 3
MEAALVNSIHYSLHNFLYHNAIFMAERLVANEKNDLSVQLLATAYLASGKPNQALAVLDGATSVRNRYLFALCAFKLGKLHEAERALVGDSHHLVPQNVPNGAAGLYLLGLICKKQNQFERAKKCFAECLKINPFLWSSYETLANMGANVDPAEFFGTEVSTTTTVPSITPVVRDIADIPSDTQHKEPVRTDKPKLLSTPQVAKKMYSFVESSPLLEDQEDFSFTLRVNPVLDLNLGKKFRDKGLPTASPFVAASKTKTSVVEPLPTSHPESDPATHNTTINVPRKKSNPQQRVNPTVTPSTVTKQRLSHGPEISSTKNQAHAKTNVTEKNCYY